MISSFLYTIIFCAVDFFRAFIKYFNNNSDKKFTFEKIGFIIIFIIN